MLNPIQSNLDGNFNCSFFLEGCIPAICTVSLFLFHVLWINDLFIEYDEMSMMKYIPSLTSCHLI